MADSTNFDLHDHDAASQVEHVRHRPPSTLERERELLLVVAPLRSQVNLSNIARTASCCGLTKIVACGQGKLDKTVARDGADQLEIEVHRTLLPVLKELRKAGWFLAALEQTTTSVNMHEYAFPRKLALVIGNERHGLSSEELALMDVCLEIPVWGLPHSYNVANASAMALYEYCRQYPRG